MKNKSKSKLILMLFIVATMTLLFVGCDLDTSVTVGPDVSANGENENKTNVVFSIDNTMQKNDKWKMTYKECQIKNEIDSFMIAEDGTEFVIVFFEIENISEEEQNFSLFWEKFYIDGVRSAQALCGVLINNVYQLTAIQLDPGRKANGYFFSNFT